MELYSIKNVKTNRYITHCDENWYEATAGEIRLFTKEEAEAIAKQLRNHYVYNVVISNGTETYEYGKKKTPTAQAVKKSIGKIKIKI